MISLFGNPEPTYDPSPTETEDVPRTDKPLALRRLAQMLEEDATARERRESGAVHELDRLTSRLRDSDPETSSRPAQPDHTHDDHPANPWIRPTTIAR